MMIRRVSALVSASKIIFPFKLCSNGCVFAVFYIYSMSVKFGSEYITATSNVFFTVKREVAFLAGSAQQLNAPLSPPDLLCVKWDFDFNFCVLPFLSDVCAT